MPVVETAAQKMIWTILVVWYWITLPIFWIEFLWFLFVLYFIFISLDYLTWYTAARRVSKVYSKIEREWLMMKLQILMLIWVSIIVVWWLNYSLWIASIFIWLVTHFFIWYFILAEFKSILENYVVIFKWTKHEKFFKLLDYLVTKLFNTSLDKLKEVSERKIEEKFNK